MDRQGRNNMPLGEMLYLGKSLIGERRVHKSHKAISRFKGKKAILIYQALYLRAIADSSLYPKNHLCFKSQWKWFYQTHFVRDAMFISTSDVKGKASKRQISSI